MKYCSKCGAECEDNASFCSICGNKLPESGYRPNNAFENQENSQSSKDFNNSYSNDSQDQGKTFGILAIVFGIIGINILGIIFGAIGLSKSKDSSSKTLCMVGLIISIIHIVIQFVVYLLYYTGVISGFFYI